MTMTTFKKMLLSFAIACGVATSAHAAQMSVCKPNLCPPEKVNGIVVNGDFVNGDAAKFRTMIGSMSRDKPIIVMLEKNHGGPLVEGLKIGDAIHDAGAGTAVSTYCYSSCAIAWLGGAVRAIKSQAQVGFHAAFFADTRAVAAPGNALMGFYIARLGLGATVAMWATAAAPDQISVVTPALAKQINLPITFLR
jgi:hypothetical protein